MHLWRTFPDVFLNKGFSLKDKSQNFKINADFISKDQFFYYKTERICWNYL